MNNKKKLFLGIVGVGLLGLVGAGVGLLNNVNAVETKATGVSGTITLDLTNSRDSGDYWYSSACNVALNFHDSEWTKQEWSSYVHIDANQMYVEIPYNVTSFDPDQFSIVRYSGSFSESDWISNRWAAETDNKWAEVKNLSYSDNAHVLFVGYETVWMNNFAKVMGGESGKAWTEIAQLNKTKLNPDNHHCEYYLPSVTLTAGQAFKVVYKDEYYGFYSIGEGVNSGNFGGGSGNDIEINATGIYSLYFDASTHNVHIANPEYAAVDGWAEAFNEVDEFCDAEDTDWASVGDSFALLTATAQGFFNDATANASGNNLEKAAYRYDNAVTNHGKTPFAGGSRASGAKNSLSLIDNKSSVTPVLVITACALAVAGTGVFFVTKRKHSDQ